MAKLTKTSVEAAPLRPIPYFVWCQELPGFGVRIFPSGKRVYYADYRIKNGSRRRIAIGPHGKLTTEEARKLAIVTLGDVLKGGDPAEERSVRRNSLTVGELCDRYLESAGRGLIMGKSGKSKKASTLDTDRGRVKRHIKPLLGAKLVRDLTQVDINRFVRDVMSGKTATVEKTSARRGKAIVTGGAGAAARTTGLLGGILSFAVSEGIIPFNPVRGVRRPADNRRQRRLTADEYRQLGSALRAAEASGETQQAINAAWLLALTACRLGEIEGLKWSEVDEQGGCFRLHETKQGASIRPIGRPAFDVLGKIAKNRSATFILVAVKGKGPFGGMPGAWRRLASRAGLPDVTPHTLRHSFASVAADLGFSESTIAAMIGHAVGSVTGRYMHHLDSVLIAAADKVARTIYEYMTETDSEEAMMINERGEDLDRHSLRSVGNG